MNASKVFKRLFVYTPPDPVRFWRARAEDPGWHSVMWANAVYNDGAHRDHWRTIARHLPARRGAVLDLGCGTGRLTRTLTDLFDQYVGVDLDTMVAEARRRHPGSKAQFVASPVQRYEFPSERFDLVLSMACLASACTATELPDTAARIVAATRPGGHVVLIDPFHRTPVLARTCRIAARRVIDLFTRQGMILREWTGIHFALVRLALAGSPAAPRGVTRLAYSVGEALNRVAPRRLADYQVIALEKHVKPFSEPTAAARDSTRRST